MLLRLTRRTAKIPVASCAVLLSIASAAIGRPLPLTQLNHPVISPGQTGTPAVGTDSAQDPQGEAVWNAGPSCH